MLIDGVADDNNKTTKIRIRRYSVSWSSWYLRIITYIYLLHLFLNSCICLLLRVTTRVNSSWDSWKDSIILYGDHIFRWGILLKLLWKYFHLTVPEQGLLLSKQSIPRISGNNSRNLFVMKLESEKFKTIFNPELNQLLDIFQRHQHEIRVAGGAVRYHYIPIF